MCYVFLQFAELTTFLLVVIVFLAAYGVSRHSLLYGQTEASWKIFTDILFHPYWQLYGELKFEESMKSNVFQLLKLPKIKIKLDIYFKKVYHFKQMHLDAIVNGKILKALNTELKTYAHKGMKLYNSNILFHNTISRYKNIKTNILWYSATHFLLPT